MQLNEIVRELALAAGWNTARLSRDDSNPSSGPEHSLIGLFQAFRPEGIPQDLASQFPPQTIAFMERLDLLYQSVRDSRRGDSMQDAYFVVRNPPMLAADHARQLGQSWLDNLRFLAEHVESTSSLEALTNSIRIRVLEGKAPKHPKAREEKAELLLCLTENLPATIEQAFHPESLASQLSEPLYFVACDRLLRDFLRWPLVEHESDLKIGNQDCLRDYFELWRHGVKFRVFANDQIDLYLPRRHNGTLLDAGQFAYGKHSS